MRMRDRVEDLQKRRAAKRAMGGAERVERQRKRGKLDARARIDLLFDPASFEEFAVVQLGLSIGQQRRSRNRRLRGRFGKSRFNRTRRLRRARARDRRCIWRWLRCRV